MDTCAENVYADKRLRLFDRRRARMARPPTDDMRLRNPCRLLRTRLLG